MQHNSALPASAHGTFATATAQRLDPHLLLESLQQAVDTVPALQTLVLLNMCVVAHSIDIAVAGPAACCHARAGPVPLEDVQQPKHVRGPLLSRLLALPVSQVCCRLP